MLGFLLRMGVTALGLWLADQWISGIEIHGAPTLVAAAILLGLVNAVVRPVAVFLTLPLTVVTLGLFLWVINAAMVGLVAWLLPGLEVAGFASALLAAVVVAVTGWLGAAFIGPEGRYEVMVIRRERTREGRR
ncbi:MAG: phage holin family protein [bacterium]